MIRTLSVFSEESAFCNSKMVLAGTMASNAVSSARPVVFSIDASRFPSVATNRALGPARNIKTPFNVYRASSFEMANEVASTNTPAGLLLLAYDENYPEKARFEAIRKLALMRLDLGNERKRVDNNPSEQFNRF